MFLNDTLFKHYKLHEWAAFFSPQSLSGTWLKLLLWLAFYLVSLSRIYPLQVQIYPLPEIINLFLSQIFSDLLKITQTSLYQVAF